MTKQQYSDGRNVHRGPPTDAELQHIYAPAMPPRLPVEAIARGIARWRQRRSMRRLLQLDDHLLQDLGYRRQDLARATRGHWLGTSSTQRPSDSH